MPKVNPEILIWARQAAGLTLGEAAGKLDFRTLPAEHSTADEAQLNALLRDIRAR